MPASLLVHIILTPVYFGGSVTVQFWGMPGSHQTSICHVAFFNPKLHDSQFWWVCGNSLSILFHSHLFKEVNPKMSVGQH